MNDISSEVQAEVARLRDTIATTKALLPGGNANFAFYEHVIEQAEKAIREQDAAKLVRMLPNLQAMG